MQEVKLKEESRLLNQILETNISFSFEEIIRSLQNLILGMEFNIN